MFIYDQIKGVGQNLWAAGKAAQSLLGKPDPDYTLAFTEKATRLSETISSMSVDDWDQALKSAAAVVSENIDFTLSSAFFTYAPKAFISMANITSRSPLRDRRQIARFSETAQRLSRIELAVDEAAQVHMLRETFAPAAVGVTEAAAPALATANIGTVGVVDKTDALVDAVLAGIRAEMRESPEARAQRLSDRSASYPISPETAKNFQITILKNDFYKVKLNTLKSYAKLAPKNLLSLRNIGYERAFDSSLVVNPTKEQLSLFSWINTTVNMAVDIYENPTVYYLKPIMADTIMLCAVAHDLTVKGEVKRAADVTQIAYAVVDKYVEYMRIMGWHALNRIVSISRRPDVFIYDQIKGIGHLIKGAGCLLWGAGKVLVAPLIFPKPHDPERDLEWAAEHALSITEKLTRFSETISSMSADDWDQALKTAAAVVGEMGVDFILSYPLFTYAPKAFTPLAKAVKAPVQTSKEMHRFVAATARRLNPMKLVLDEATQARVMGEIIAPAAVGVTEAAPALATEGAGVFGAVAKTESSVAANASKAIQKAEAAVGEAIAAENVAKQGALEAQNAIKVAETAATESAGTVAKAEHAVEQAVKAAARTVEDVLKECVAWENQTGSTKQYSKLGSFQEVLKDFESLPLSNIKDYSNGAKECFVGYLADGKTVTARSWSKKLGPTLEIKYPNSNKVIKIRYS